MTATNLTAIVNPTTLTTITLSATPQCGLIPQGNGRAKSDTPQLREYIDAVAVVSVFGAGTVPRMPTQPHMLFYFTFLDL